MITYSGAAVLALTVHAILYGVYVAVFFRCLRWLMYADDGWRVREKIDLPLLTVTFLIFGLSTADLCISLDSTLKSLSNEAGSFHVGSVITIAVESLTAVITDGVLIWRCWMVYGKPWRVAAIPVILLLYNIASVVAITYWGYLGLMSRTRAFHAQIVYVREGFLISTIVINIYATSAIIFQIWRYAISRHLLQFTTRLVAESGLLYTFTSIMLLCAISVKNAATGLELPRMLATAINSPMAGIAYSLLLIRVAHHRANDDRAGHTSSLDFRADFVEDV